MRKAWMWVVAAPLALGLGVLGLWQRFQARMERRGRDLRPGGEMAP